MPDVGLAHSQSFAFSAPSLLLEHINSTIKFNSNWFLNLPAVEHSNISHHCCYHFILDFYISQRKKNKTKENIHTAIIYSDLHINFIKQNNGKRKEIKNTLNKINSLYSLSFCFYLRFLFAAVWLLSFCFCFLFLSFCQWIHLIP